MKKHVKQKTNEMRMKASEFEKMMRQALSVAPEQRKRSAKRKK
jgi:hypothetical protein